MIVTRQVMQHKLEQRKNGGRKAKAKGGGRSGGLKRLGITVNNPEVQPPPHLRLVLELHFPTP